MSVVMNRAAGEKAELLALNFLLEKGLSLRAKNYYCRLGEIDLIMKENDTLVFIEVRARKSDWFGGASQSVDRKKQGHIINSAKYYLAMNSHHDNIPCRIDVVTVNGGDNPEIHWIKNAIIE
jgi:putative endonuclease